LVFEIMSLVENYELAGIGNEMVINFGVLRF